MTKRKLLEGHKQEGKKFIPEITKAIPLHEVNWTNDLVPELIWIAILHQKYGYFKGNCIASEFHTVYVSVCKNNYFHSFLSSYESMDEETKWVLKAEFSKNQYYEDFRRAMIDFHIFFLVHPFDFLFSDFKIDGINGDIEVIKSAIIRLSDRRSKEAMIVQASFIVNSLVTKKLNIIRGSIFERMHEIDNYPNTEDSVRLGSSIRASINTYMSPGITNRDSKWTKRFWQRCIEIEPSKIRLSL